MKVKHISNHEFQQKFGLVHTTTVAFVTGNDRHDQHFVRKNTPAQITRKVNKLKQAWGV
jgi:hypothetical protein